ncbi:MAG TPA: DUF1015 domain-containing protein [Firmicutes bacterium]|nr:DUF1015 domain-containing protein [Bacillota bacterium]
MPQLAPFRGIHFHPTRMGKDLGVLICPPYDTVDEETAQSLEAQHPYNCVRLELCAPPENPSPQRYRKAALRWQSWRRQGVLVQDGSPSVYVCRHAFSHAGRRLVRTALVGCLVGGVMVHEETMTAAKEDRMQLLRACRAQFSPILVLYEDPEGRVASRCAGVESLPPALEARLGEEELRVWRLEDRDLVNGILRALDPLPAVIADGHHRYESVRQFTQEESRDGHTRVLAALVSTADPGLVVLPPHRLVRASAGSAARLTKAVVAAFGGRATASPVAVPAAVDQGATGWWAVLEPLAGSEGTATSLVAASREGAWVLRCQGDTAEALGLLDHALGGAPAGDDAPGAGVRVEYTQDAVRALREVLNGQAEVAFLVPAVPVEEVFRKARKACRFPRKTTYFYPKMPAGLIMCDLDGE